MKAAHHTTLAHALVVLDETYGTHEFIEVALRETLEEVPAGILEHARLYNEHPFNICLNNIHLGLTVNYQLSTVN